MMNSFLLNTGVSLLLMSTVAFIVIIFRISINPSSPPVESSSNDTSCCCFPSFRNRTTLFSMGLALICALIMVFWYMVCFALWIAGSYLVIITIKKMRMPSPNHQSGCDLSVVSVAGSATIFIWIVFFGFCCSTVYSVFNNNFLRRQDDSERSFELFGGGQRNRDIAAQQKLNNEHIYDKVPTNDGLRNYNIYDTVTN